MGHNRSSRRRRGPSSLSGLGLHRKIVGPKVRASGVEVAVASGVVELTDSGGSGSRILDGEEDTDIEVAAVAAWLNRVRSWDSVMQVELTQSQSHFRGR